MLVAAICGLFLLPATAAAGAYALYTLVGWARPTVRSGGTVPTLRRSFAVLIPAHNEALGIATAIRSVRKADAGVPVFVVADNCTDATATVAKAEGAAVLERFDLTRRGKGFALAFGLPAVLETNVDTVVILDADCTLSSGAFRAFDREFAIGAEAVQAVLRSANPDAGPAGLMAAIGCAIESTAAVGRDRLGLSVPLRGTGMAFTRELLERHPWAGFGPAEDAEYARTLAAAGVRVRYVADAVVSSDAPADATILLHQRRRWRAALAPVSFRTIAASKPLVLLHLTTTVLASIASGSSPLIAWSTVLVLLTGFVYVRAIHEIGLAHHRLWNLVKLPGLVFRLAGVTAAGAVVPPVGWDRTPRPGEACRTAA